MKGIYKVTQVSGARVPEFESLLSLFIYKIGIILYLMRNEIIHVRALAQKLVLSKCSIKFNYYYYYYYY